MIISEPMLTDSNQEQTFTVEFSESMLTDGSADPVIGLSAGFWAVIPGAWSDSATWVQIFALADQNQHAAGVDVTVSGARDAGGTPMDPATHKANDLFAIDTRNPSLIRVLPRNEMVNTNTGVFVATFTFNEAMDAAWANTPTVVFSPAVAGALIPFETGWNSTTEFWHAFMVDDSANVEIDDVAFHAEGAVDVNGNPQAPVGAGVAGTIDLDLIRPTASIDQVSEQGDPTSASPISFVVTASEPIVGFDDDDVILGGTAGPTTAVVAEIAPNDGTTCRVDVSGMSGPGTVTIDVMPYAFQDAAGNDNKAWATVVGNEVVYQTQ